MHSSQRDTFDDYPMFSSDHPALPLLLEGWEPFLPWPSELMLEGLVLSVGLCGLLKQDQKPDSCGFGASQHQAPF